jgi:hypothetical protein
MAQEQQCHDVGHADDPSPALHHTHDLVQQQEGGAQVPPHLSPPPEPGLEAISEEAVVAVLAAAAPHMGGLAGAARRYALLVRCPRAEVGGGGGMPWHLLDGGQGQGCESESELRSGWPLWAWVPGVWVEERG